MPHKQRVSLALLLLVAVCWPVAAQAAPGKVPLDLMCPITAVDAPAPDGSFTFTIGRGSAHGLVVGARGDVFGRGEKSGISAVIGRGELVEVAELAGKVRFLGGPHAKPEGVVPGAQIELRALLPVDLHRGVLFELYLTGIELLDNMRQPIAEPARLFAATDSSVEDAALDAMIAAGHEVVEFTTDFKDPLERGKWKGKVMADVLAGADREDYRRFLRFVADYPGKYIGKAWKISEVFATWLLNNAPPAHSDHFEELVSIEDRKGRKQAVAAADDDELEGVLGYVRREVDEWPAARIEEARARLRQMEDLLALRAEPTSLMRAEVTLTKAIVLALEPKKRVEAAAAYKEAAGHFLAAGEVLEGLVAGNNSIGKLYDAERYDEALAAVEAQRATIARELAKAVNPQLVAAIPLREAFAMRIRGGVLKIRGEYRTLIEELTPLVVRYREAGFRGAREDQLELLTLIAGAQVKLGEDEAATATYARMAALVTELDDDARLAKLAYEVGDMHWDRSRWSEAAAEYERSAQFAAKAGDLEAEAKAIGAKAQSLWNLGKHREAIAEHERGMAIREREGDRSGIAWQSLMVGKIYREMGDREQARALFQQALGIRRELGQRVSEAEVLVEIGELELALSRFDEADARFAEAREIYRGEKMAVDEGRTLEAGARVSLGRKDYPGAVARIEEALARFASVEAKGEMGPTLVWKARILHRMGERKAAGEAYRAARNLGLEDEGIAIDVLRGLSGLAWDEGRTKEARKLAEEALARAEKSGDVTRRLAALGAMHDVLSRQARYEESLALLDRQIDLARESGNRPQLVSALQLKSWTLATLGRYSEAQKLLEEAEPIAKQNDDPVEEAWLLNGMSKVRESYGDLREALALYDRGIALMHEAGYEYGEAGLIFNRSRIWVSLRDLERALADSERAEKLAGKHSNIELEVALLMSRGEALTYMGEYERAEKTLRSALDRARGALDARVPETLGLLVRLMVRQKRYDEALAVAEEAVAIESKVAGEQYGALEQLGVVQAAKGELKAAEGTLTEVVRRAEKRGGRLPWESLYRLGQVQAKTGRADEAVATLKRAITEIERGQGLLADREAAARHRADMNEAYLLIVKLLLRKGAASDALDYLERAKTTELVELGRQAGTGGDPEAELAAELEAQEHRFQQLIDEELSKAQPDEKKLGRLETLIDGVRHRRAEFIEKLDRNSSLFDRYAIRPMQLEQIQQELDEGVLVLSPVILDDTVVVFAVTAKALTHFQQPVESGEVAALVEAYLGEMDTRTLTRGKRIGGKRPPASAVADSLAKLEPPARRLYDLLVRSTFETLGTPKTLVVSAAGILRYVPFAGLLDGDTWLGERTVVVNMTALNQTDFGGNAGPLSPKATVLALADPDGSLPGARREVDALAEVFPGTHILGGADATYRALQRQVRAPGYDVLHLATHGRLDPENPQRSNILLAGEPLRYADIPTLKPKRTRLVVLSACDTAARAGGTGAEIAGLAYQFQRMRIDGVLATLWPVDDEATAALMASFYGNLKKGERQAVALADSQRALMASGEARYRHPAFWAPFVLMGSP